MLKYPQEFISQHAKYIVMPNGKIDDYFGNPIAFVKPTLTKKQLAGYMKKHYHATLK